MYLYREGEIPDGIRQQIEQHVGACERCAHEWKGTGRAAEFVVRLRSAEPRLQDRQAMTDRIMDALESAETGHAQPHPFRAALSFRRLQLSCTLAAAAIVAAFFVQNVIDVYRLATLERRLSQSSSPAMSAPDGSHLAVAGLNTIAEMGRMLFEPPAEGNLGLQGQLQLRESAREFFDVLREGPPGFSGEVQRLREKYPELWFVSPLEGLSAQDRLVLAQQGKALMRDIHGLLQSGDTDHED